MSTLTKIRSLFETDQGASLSNEYEVEVIPNSTRNSQLLTNFAELKFTNFNVADGAYKNMMLLCDEASLPGQFAATQEIDGLYTGRLIQYPHARLYNDFSLSFIMTNNELPIKFFETWFYTIFPERRLNDGTALELSLIHI